MASNVFSVNVYQIGQRVLSRDSPQKIGFPTTGVLILDVSGSPTRSLSSGYNVYGAIVLPATGQSNLTGTIYYTAETQSQLITLVNA